MPLIYVEQEKTDYIKHIINVPSEVEFVKNLEKHISDKQFNFDWMFIKVDEHLDKKLGMPYFTEDNFYRDFYPDFIFWIKAKKGNAYKIIFIDPKGGSLSAPQKKIDGFKKLFEENSVSKVFTFNHFSITFSLYFIGEDQGGDAYRKYWIRQGDFSFLSM